MALAGPSGAGKSTLMRCLYGNYGAGDGPHPAAPRRRRWWTSPPPIRALVREVRRDTLGYVTQFLRVIPRVAALDIVAEPLVARGVARDEALRPCRGAADAAEPAGHACTHLPPATFSGGEQQRVNLARGFAPDYPVLLLDEPTASLDAANREVVIGLIEEAKARGAAIVGIFHDTEVRDRVADRLFEVLPLPEAA